MKNKNTMTSLDDTPGPSGELALQTIAMPKDTNAPRETKSQNRFECRTMYIVRHCCATFRFLHLAQNTQWPPQGR